MPSHAHRTLHVFTNPIFIKEERSIPWEKEIKLFILTLESETLGVEGNSQFIEFTFLPTSKHDGTQRYGTVSPYPFGYLAVEPRCQPRIVLILFQT